MQQRATNGGGAQVPPPRPPPAPSGSGGRRNVKNNRGGDRRGAEYCYSAAAVRWLIVATTILALAPYAAFCVFELDVPPDVVPPPASRPFSGPSGSGVGGGGDGGPPDIEDGNDGRTTIARSRRPPPPPPKARATIAYAVSLTSCGDMAHRTGGGHSADPSFGEGAAVLKHSIHLSSIRNWKEDGGDNNSVFDYEVRSP